jgi:ATP-dependent helicase STH1/SNF2
MFIFVSQALEEGEDLQELAERARDKKDRRAMNKLLRETETSGRGTPISDTESRGRKGKKGKNKMNAPDYEPVVPIGNKRKRGVKSLSVTPSINEEDDEDRDQVFSDVFRLRFGVQLSIAQKRRKMKQPVDLPLAVREKMKKAFAECYRAVLACEDNTGRKRCELFRDLPDKRVNTIALQSVLIFDRTTGLP